MKALLHTHTFLWWITDDARLSSRVRELTGDSTNTLFLSAASGWEIAIKAQLGKLQLPDNLERYIADQLSLNGFESLPIQLHHALHVYTLPNLHRDPFDRILVAQSQLDQLPILTVDPQIARYRVEVIW